MNIYDFVYYDFKNITQIKIKVELVTPLNIDNNSGRLINSSWLYGGTGLTDKVNW
jgi:hypothetical protein